MYLCPGVYLYFISLPFNVKGVTMPCEDGTCYIYINDELTADDKIKALRHELSHIQHNHLYCDSCVAVDEIIANAG